MHETYDAKAAPPALTAIFAVPGDLDTPTGGYSYARQLIAAAPKAGLTLRVMPLPGDFPNPSMASVAAAAQGLTAVRSDVPVLVDGLAFGAMPAEAVSGVRAPLAVLLHHPLGLEDGNDAATAERLLRTERAALRHARAIVVTSEATKADAVAHLGADPAVITVARPGLDLPGAPHATAHSDMPLLLSVGSLTPRKGHDVLIAALARLADRPWRLVIAGAPYRDTGWTARLAGQAEAAGLSSRIVFAGAVAPDALETLYAEANLFCLPSRHEGYGMVFAEAMAHGLPGIAADIAAAREVIPSGAGLRVPVDDPAMLADALARLLDDPAAARAMGETGRAHAAGLPSWAETAACVAAALRAIAP
jgi:glycosyltransferase involved in cell wall biosynthesis